jgi:uncharacterized protein (UPF0548 family)
MDLRAALAAPLTYSEVGATRGPLPPGYHNVELDMVIGFGATAFAHACRTLMSWDMHRQSGLDVQVSTPTVREGSVVLMKFGMGPASFSIPCRVIYLVDQAERQGFAYGTLQGHPESGEEAFVVELRPDGAVHVVITAFSRPGRWYTRLGGPVGRLVQRSVTQRYVRALRT